MTDLGPCCICETTEKVFVIMTLDRPSPTPGRGWGCVVCGLPSDGAMAVLCEQCAGRYQEGQEPLRFICTGYPGPDGRTPILEAPGGVFEHDMTKHEEGD